MMNKQTRDVLLQFAQALVEEEPKGEPGEQYVPVPLWIAKEMSMRLQLLVAEDVAEETHKLKSFLSQYKVDESVTTEGPTEVR